MAEKADTSATPAGRPDDGAVAQAAAFRGSADEIRRRADLAAKTFGGLATTAVTAIGIAKFSDVFPVPPGEEAWVVGLIGGFVLMLAVVGFFTVRLWRVNEPMVLKSSVEAMADDLRDQNEKSIVGKIYDEVARLNRTPSLLAYEARGQRLLRIADRVADEARATKVAEKANVIIGDILATETRALMVIARRRAAHAVGDTKAGVAYSLAILGIAAFGISADRLDSQRKGVVDIAKACADTNTAGATNLPPICGTFTAKPSDTPAAAKTQALKDLGAALGRCEAARPSSTGTDPCAALQEAFTAAKKP